MTGDAPAGAPSIVTCAPGGSVVTDNAPDVIGEGVFVISRSRTMSAPAPTVTGSTRSLIPLRMLTVCGPGLTESVSGVIPRDCPSTMTLAPSG